MTESTLDGTDTDDAGGAAASALSGIRLDAVVAALSFLMVLGIALDFNRHAQGISFAEEGFFTPEHVFFYSMFLGITVTIGAATLLNRRSGAKWIAAVPPGYAWGVVGVLAFGLGGVADFGWHSTFGFEEGFEALTSPSHLLLATGAVLFLASPLRAGMRRRGRTGGRQAIPAVVSAGLAVTIVALFSAYVNPYARPAPLIEFGEPWIGPNLGMATWAFYPLLLVGTALLLVRHFELPVGSMTVVFVLPSLASTTLGGHAELVWSVVLAGVIADGFVKWWTPVPTNPRAIRVFGAVVPGIAAVTYFGIVAYTAEITWVAHVWGGAIATAALAGLLVTYVAVPDGSLVASPEGTSEAIEEGGWADAGVRADGGEGE